MKKARRIGINAILAGLMVLAVSFPGAAMPAPALGLPDGFKEWEAIQNRGSSALDANRYGEAERILREAVTKARALGADELCLARSPGDLGRLLTIRARFSEAEPYLEEELRIKERYYGYNSGEIIPSLGSMIAFYLSYGSATKAERLTDDLLALVEGKMREEISEAESKMKPQKGAPLQGWAGTADPKAHGHLMDWAITCDQIGTMYSERGKYEIADKLFKTALDAKATVLGKQHLSLANSYDSLGAICLAKDENREAESYLTESLGITEKIQPPEDPQVYARMDRLARCLIKEKKYDEAEKIYLQANRLWRTAPSKCGNEARCLYSLGCLYADEKRYAAAAQMLHRGLRMSEHFNGEYSIAIVPYLRKYAYVLYYLGRRGEESQAKARANSIAPEVKPMKATVAMQAGAWKNKKTADESKPEAKTKSLNSTTRHSRHKSSRRKHSRRR